jgi:hypothetical protein
MPSAEPRIPGEFTCSDCGRTQIMVPPELLIFTDGRCGNCFTIPGWFLVREIRRGLNFGDDFVPPVHPLRGDAATWYCEVPGCQCTSPLLRVSGYDEPFRGRCADHLHPSIPILPAAPAAQHGAARMTAIDNAWAHYWAGLMRQAGGASRLPLAPLDEEELFSETVTVPPAKGTFDYEPYGADGTWRRKLSGSIRNHRFTLADLLPMLNDYFASFRYLRRCDRQAYAYYSRVGLPLHPYKGSLWRVELDDPPLIKDPASLPMCFGSYNPVPRDEDRTAQYQMPHVTYMFRHKTAVVAAAPDMIVYQVVEWYTRRPWAERGLAKKNVGFYWYLGIGSDGFCRALPFRWFSQYRTNRQKTYTESYFGIPGGLVEMAECAKSGGALKEPSNRSLVDRWAHLWFSCVRALSMGALDGVQVSFRRDGMTARVGIPLQQVSDFFRDRELTGGVGNRRGKIFHSVAAHERHMADGRTVAVGEQFRGIREFDWKGYRVLITVPGMHHPAVEGLATDAYDEELLDKRKGIDMPALGRKVARRVWQDNAVRMRKGQPTRRYADNPFFADEALRARDQQPYQEKGGPCKCLSISLRPSCARSTSFSTGGSTATTAISGCFGCLATPAPARPPWPSIFAPTCPIPIGCGFAPIPARRRMYCSARVRLGRRRSTG